MEAVAVSALLNILVPKLTEAYTLYKTYMNRREELATGTDFHSIKEELAMRRATIEDNHKWGTAITYERKAWIERVSTFAQDTEDYIDLFLHRALHMSIEDFAIKIKALQARSEAIKQDNPWPPAREEAAASEQESNQVVKDNSSKHVVGMDEPIRRLLEQVGQPAGEPAAGSNSEEVKRKVISIVGFGGLGKTRLANEVYNHTEVKEQFPLRAWVRAAGNSALKVLQEIRKELKKGASTSTNYQQAVSGGKKLENGASTSTGGQQVDSRGKKLDNGASTSTGGQQVDSRESTIRELLEGKKYCIVIDDIQTRELWTKIQSSFPEDADGRIIVTTTMETVANLCTFENGYKYKMPTLSMEMSQKLFLQPVPLKKRPAEMGDGLTGLLKKCDGLPLALVSVLEYLKCKEEDILRNERSCKHVCSTFRNCLEKDEAFCEMRKVLVKKYNSLPNHGVKACLLYFYLFPSDDPIKGASLIRHLLAEGFIEVKAQTLQDVVAGYLETLVENSIMKHIQPCNSEMVKSCRPHGIMLEYISYKSISENFITFLSGEETLSEEQLKNSRRFSLHDGAADNINCIRGVNLSLVRTLAVSGKAHNAILDFSKYELLRVLDLKECEYQLKQKQLDDICERLRLLKYLSLGNLKKTIRNLPRKLGKLILLETLEMRRNEEPIGVYEEVIRLPRLIHLIGKFMLRVSPSEELEKFLSDDSMLETVTGFVTGNRGGFAWLLSRISMVHLRKVKIWYDSNADKQNLNVDLTEAIKKFTLHGVHDRSLSIHLATYSEPVLKSVQDGRSLLTSLKLSGNCTESLPSTQATIIPIGLKCVQGLCLSWTQLGGAAILSVLSDLDALKDLKLVDDDLGPLVLRSGEFKGLERIRLVCEVQLDITIEDNALPQLVSLHMICEALGGPAGIQIGRHEKLKEIVLHPGVVPEIIRQWRQDAGLHPNRPNVLFIDSKSRVQHNPIVRKNSIIQKLLSGPNH